MGIGDLGKTMSITLSSCYVPAMHEMSNADTDTCLPWPLSLPSSDLISSWRRNRHQVTHHPLRPTFDFQVIAVVLCAVLPSQWPRCDELLS